MLNKFIEKNKTLVIFIKRCIKYISILAILILMIVPLLLKSYTLAKQLTIDKSNTKLKEGVNALEAQVIKAQEIGNLLRNENTFKQVFFLSGFPSSEYYVDINILQSKLKSLALTQDMLSNVYIVFKDNPIYISNHIASDNNADVYEKYFNYENMTVSEWYDLLYKDNYVVKFVPNKQVFSSYYKREYFEGITCLINNSYFNSIDQKSVLACVFDKKDIINKVLYEDQRENCFAYITGSDNQLLFTHNYLENESLKDVKNLGETTLSSKKYITLTYTSDKLGLQTVVGIPMDLFEKNINSMLELVLLYVIIGTLVIILLSLLFSMKETLWLKKLVEIASKSTKTIFNISNEYSYINNAITKISSINEEQLCKIEALNNSIKNSVVKNLLILGVYTDNEKKEVESYFSNSFENFCVVKVNYRIDESIEVDKIMQQNTLIEIENTIKALIKNEFIALNLPSKESIFVIFFKDKENSNVNDIKNQLTETIREINLNSQIPITINIGISSIMFDVKNAKTAYQQAKYAISINENYISSGVYIYEPIQEYSYKKDFDIEILIKLYDAIVAGEKSIVDQIFSYNFKKITRYSLTEQEQLQIFFSFRQTVYNTHKVIVNERYEVKQSNLILPEYTQISDIAKLFNELKIISMNLCDIVINNKKSNNEKLKVDIVEYINKNYSDINLSASSIATELLISEKYVFSFVKEQTGKSLGKFIEEVRILNAERLLYETDYSNSQILKLCGFGSENTFYRAFSKRHSVSPVVWRENKRNITN